MKNKRKHTEQADKAEELAKRKLAKLTKVINHAIHNCLVECPKKTLFLNFASAVESLVRMGVQRPQTKFQRYRPINDT